MMNADIKMARQVLESQLRESAPSRGLSESIRIQQFADPV
jgi:hypothetical protein